MPIFRHRTRFPYPADRVFAWHLQEGAFQRLTPPWLRVRMLEGGGALAEGARFVLSVGQGPAQFRWEGRVTAFEEGRLFQDEQVSGPFRKWIHTHRFLPVGEGECVLEDEVEWEAPLGALGKLFGEPFVERELTRFFGFRHARLRNDLDLHDRYAEEKPWTVAVTGGGGLVGRALVCLLRGGGHQVVRLVRNPREPGILWDPERGLLDPKALEGVDAVVHLAGEPIFGLRWTEEKKRRILESRQRGTELLARTLAALERPPRVWVSASAVGYYGPRGAEILTEESPPGEGFLALVCRLWEEATRPAQERGIRVVHLRTGVVLSPAGGALGTLLLPFQVGVGGRLGSGRQYLSWIDLDDETGLIYHALASPGLEGPVNAVAPHPVSNAAFTDTLGRVLGRPTLVPVPAAAVRALFGEMGQALLLEGQRVLPRRAEGSGFRFRYPALEDSLRFQLGRMERD